MSERNTWRSNHIDIPRRMERWEYFYSFAATWVFCWAKISLLEELRNFEGHRIAFPLHGASFLRDRNFFSSPISAILIMKFWFVTHYSRHKATTTFPHPGWTSKRKELTLCSLWQAVKLSCHVNWKGRISGGDSWVTKWNSSSPKYFKLNNSSRESRLHPNLLLHR